jgi:hypothetical protein
MPSMRITPSHCPAIAVISQSFRPRGARTDPQVFGSVWERMCTSGRPIETGEVHYLANE